MRKITRLNRIKNHRIFQDFSWPANLPDFARFNLIYGWNGAGKTTLSNLFRHLEKRQPVTEGEVDYYIDGASCVGASLSASSAIPQVRVFNRDFVEASVFSNHSALNPIFFLGEDSVEKQKEIDKLKTNLVDEQSALTQKREEKKTAENALDAFNIHHAKAIKELLSSSGPNPFNNYNKAEFKRTCEALEGENLDTKLLTEEEKAQLKEQKEAKPKSNLSLIPACSLDITKLITSTTELLGRTVVSQVIDELASDNTVALWVQQGMARHNPLNGNNKCRFCDQPLPHDRLAHLEGHL